MTARININIIKAFNISVFTGCFLFFAFAFQYHIYFEEQLQVFIPDLSHFITYFSKPAFLSSWTGDFLSQFYYLPGAGAVIITASLLLLWYVLRLLIRRLQPSGRYTSWTILPVIAGWIALCGPEYPLSNIIAAIFSITLTYIYVSVPGERARFLSVIILLPVLYFVSGSSFYILTATGILFELSRNSRKRFLFSFSIAAVTAITPLLLKGYFLLTPLRSFTYLSEMTIVPDFTDYLPVIAVIITLSISQLQKKLTVRPAPIYLPIPVLLLFLSWGIANNASFDLERILRLDHEAGDGRWEKVLHLSEKYNMRSNLSAYYTNMALYKLGLLPDKIMDYYQPAATGLFIPVSADENYLTITLSNEIYWLLGDVNSSQHSALLGMIFSPRSQNSKLMKRLVEINIVNGEYAVAGKFISILEKTLFHRKWAAGKRKYLFNEKECKSAEWIAEKRAMIPAKDCLKNSNEYVRTLRMLADDHPDNSMAIDYLLCFHLLSKNVGTFAGDFKKYYQPGKSILPRVYQEGLLIRIASGAESRESYSDYTFSPELVKNMAEYIQLYDQYKGDGTVLEEKYGKSYWFWYHFATLQSE